MKITEYVFPDNLNDAYNLLNDNEKSIIIGGGAYLRLHKRSVNLGIDIEKLGLDYIIEEDGFLKIGSGVTLREIETNKYTKNELNGTLSEMVKQIGGVQLRNIATVGGSICGKYNFSDILPTLVALDAKLRFFKGGVIKISDFLDNQYKNDILIEIVIDLKQKVRVKYFKNTYKEYSLINLSLAFKNNLYKIAIGARPGRAKYAKLSSKVLSKEKDVDKALDILFDELEFKTDYRASAEYRKELVSIYLKEAFNEIEVK